MTDEDPDTVADVRAWADRLRASLPQSVDVAGLGVKSKAPFQLLCTREALIWRTEELARDDFAAAAIMTRAVTENAALAWQLFDVLEARGKYTPQKLNDMLMRLLGGSKAWPEAPKPVHVHDGLRKMDKKIPGVLSSYGILSEMVHPNWAGVVWLYSKDDKPNFITHFGRGLRGVDSSRGTLAELESIWSDDGDKHDATAGQR